MDLRICKPLAPEFYDISLIGDPFARNSCIIMAICDTIIRVQIILYGLICMMHHSRNLFNWISARSIPDQPHSAYSLSGSGCCTVCILGVRFYSCRRSNHGRVLWSLHRFSTASPLFPHIPFPLPDHSIVSLEAGARIRTCVILPPTDAFVKSMFITKDGISLFRIISSLFLFWQRTLCKASFYAIRKHNLPIR